MIRQLFIIVILFVQTAVFSQSFEGSIFFVKQTPSDTSYYEYMVKLHKMRVDEMNQNKNVIHSLLIDFNEGSMTALSPSRKMFMPFPVSPYVATGTSDFEIIESTDSTELMNYMCNKVTVKNLADSVLVDYWMGQGNFNFFIDFLTLSNTADKSARYYLHLKKVIGYFPMLSVEKDFSGNQRVRLEVLEVKKQHLDDSVFNIPADYISFQR